VRPGLGDSGMPGKFNVFKVSKLEYVVCPRQFRIGIGCNADPDPHLALNLKAGQDPGCCYQTKS
jgi:hypothetical protein